jgi:hypothetical protein
LLRLEVSLAADAADALAAALCHAQARRLGALPSSSLEGTPGTDRKASQARATAR